MTAIGDGGDVREGPALIPESAKRAGQHQVQNVALQANEYGSVGG